ncbi:NUDIX hydrolase N-terminal domain-containing protein [Nocardia sp. NPDC050435]|uniref:NUDIX hydrolase n=1 Tax=Nocardia sp. NPDC050435 TaxID=3155040 RepID=UPI0033CCC8C2
MGDTRASVEADLLRIGQRLADTAQNGLTYGKDAFDLQRYGDIQKLSAELLACISGQSPTHLTEILAAEAGYSTPKVDVRAGVFDAEGRILLIQDPGSELWAPPGGWCDAGETTAQAVAKEVQEEAGLTVKPRKLVAALDRDTQGHQPPLLFSCLKVYYLCDVIAEGGTPDPLETLAIGWFAIDELPPLSTTRILEHQIQLLHKHWLQPDLPALFD